MKCVILQPSYIPWRGYFHQIQKADVFIFFDDVQFDRRGWRHRNLIKTTNGTLWLTIPIVSTGLRSHATPINEVRMSNTENWREKHLKSIRHAYAKAPHFEEVFGLIEQILTNPTDSLSDFTVDSTVEIAKFLGVGDRRFIRSSQFPSTARKTDRLIEILKSVGGSHYISGPSARDYIEPQKFADAKIGLEYMVYDYPEYDQLYPPFEPQVSIVDLMFMMGKNSSAKIWG